jgi:secondary thiamine-phosphate synthase enzyme
VQNVISSVDITLSFCNIFILHTSASLMICENADERVLDDLEYWLGKNIPQYDKNWTHTSEGADDMPSHIRSVITSASLNVPIKYNKLYLGTWQGIFLYEHRVGEFQRKIVITAH